MRRPSILAELAWARWKNGEADDEATLAPIYLHADTVRLTQVFTNLINNAVEVMRSTGGSLSVNVGTNLSIPNNPQVEVTVADNGPGIPDEIRDHIFEPFVSNNKRGTGLGLAITKRIVTAHKGTITVSSIPGATIFTVLFPADVAAAA